MSIPQQPKPAKLVVGFFLREKGLTADLAGRLESGFGPIDVVSPWMRFDYTRYYEEETGAHLIRRLLAFKPLIAQQDLPGVKEATNAIEQSLAAGGRRRVNIDPGYLTLERFVLASGKNFSHRIYLGRGIYADLTLVYRHGAFQPLPWTYPDYGDLPLRRFLKKVRDRYAADLKTCATDAHGEKDPYPQ
jgi:hypothetical protein